MAKKGIVSKKEQQYRDAYQAYLRGKRWGTATKSAKESLKEADSYYVWKKKQMGKSKKPKSKGPIAAIKDRRAAERKTYKEATGREMK